MLEKESVLAVVVTYHPDSSFAERFEHLAGQVGAVLIVDNDSGPAAVSMLNETAVRLNMGLILNSRNVGLATALNIGVAHAIANGYEWVLLFDQDTVPGDSMLEGLQEAYNDFPRKDKIAIIGSNYSLPHTGELPFSKLVANGRPWRERKAVITSGSLLSLPIYGMLGPFRDEYFIDCVDLEYCLRARSRGFEVIMTCKPLMVHGIGQLTHHRLLWKRIAATNHSPLRRYYIIKNHVALLREYIFREPLWVLSRLSMLLKDFVILLLFERERLKKTKHLVMGLVDGFLAKPSRMLKRS